MKLRKMLAAALCLLLAASPAAFAKNAAVIKTVPDECAVIDTDGSDGYSGDYVVIYNPSVSASSGLYTGALTGLITGVDGAAEQPAAEELDITASLLTEYRGEFGEMHSAFEGRSETTEYSVGDTLTYVLNDYSPAGGEVEFKVLAVGEHCYVWTPSGDDPALWPLDGIDESFAQEACSNFDACYPAVAQYIGSYTEGVKINLLYYNIEDNWQTGNPYISGFFSPMDCYSNHRPIISLDTYPGVYYPTGDGGWESRLSRSFGIAVHEYQHMINFLAVGNMDVWLNEALSSATEEICYPGSCLNKRIPDWLNCGADELLNDPQFEYEYTPGFDVHNGASLYAWDDSGADIGALYGQVTLFAQYLYSHYGNGIFKQIIQNYSACGSVAAVLGTVTGADTGALVRSFRIAVTANDPEGEYSFSMQPGYDPALYGGETDLYNRLAPLVYTGAGLTIYGGGAVTIKPAGGTYYPPADADAGLEYVGVTVLRGLKGDIDLDGDVDAVDALFALRYSLNLVELSNLQLRLGDVDGNGRVNGGDALMILRYVLELIPTL